jgi:hypothetical protein
MDEDRRFAAMRSERLPGGTIHYFSAPEHPVSLPHTRHNEMVVVKVWVWAGSALAALLVFYGFYLVLR